MIAAGVILLTSAWPVLSRARRAGTLAATGPYEHIRHPKYVAFVLIMLGLLVQWPTLLTIAVFAVLVFVYVRLARQEENDARQVFGSASRRYQARVPAFIPRLGGPEGNAA